MLVTKRKPASIREILVEQFLRPFGLTQGDLADAMGVPRKHVNELCNNRRAVTADTPSCWGEYLATVPTSGSTCNAATTYGRPCIPLSAENVLSVRGGCARLSLE
jgi:addiction module HigA family antidote